MKFKLHCDVLFKDFQQKTNLLAVNVLRENLYHSILIV